MSEKVSLVDLKFAQLGDKEMRKVALNEGDLLIVRTNGSASLVGRCAVVPRLPEVMGFASYIIRIRCDPEIVDPNFLQVVLSQQRAAGSLFDFARTTAGQYNVSLGRLRNLEVPLPPIDEQRRVVAQVRNLQAKLEDLGMLLVQTADQFDALLPSILDQVLDGSL
jgi:type I restriction enzyme S subunit